MAGSPQDFQLLPLRFCETLPQLLTEFLDLCPGLVTLRRLEESLVQCLHIALHVPLLLL